MDVKCTLSDKYPTEKGRRDSRRSAALPVSGLLIGRSRTEANFQFCKVSESSNLIYNAGRLLGIDVYTYAFDVRMLPHSVTLTTPDATYNVAGVVIIG